MAPLTPTLRIPVRSREDVEQARRDVDALVSSLGFSAAIRYTLALVVSELGTNLARYGQEGELTISAVQERRGRGIEIVSRDRGPGIADVDVALQDSFSTGGGLGSGLPAVRRLSHDFSIRSSSEGTWIEMRLWEPPS